MKKLLPLLILALMLCTSAMAEYVTLITPAPTATPQLTLRPSDDEVKVYQTPSVKAKIVGYIIVGGRQEVEVVSQQGEWVKVRFTSIGGWTDGWIPLGCFQMPATPTPSPTPTPSYQANSAAFVVNPQPGYRLNLRTSPSASAVSLGKYYTGTPVTLSGEYRSGYVRASIGAVCGWLDARYITTSPLGFTSEVQQATIVNPGGGANLRQGPGTSYTRIGWYPSGMSVTVLGVREDEWYHVAVAGQTGYMSSTLLSQTFPWHYGTDSDAPAISGDLTGTGAQMYIAATNGVHLREYASAGSKSLGLYYSGCPATVVSYTRTGWAYVRIGSAAGYVDVGCLSANRPNRTGLSRTIVNPYGTGLNLRQLPDTGSPVITLCRNYTAVTVLADLPQDWCYVVVGGQYGYMMGVRLEAR